VKVLNVEDIYFLTEQVDSLSKLVEMWNEIRDYFGKESLIDVTTYSTNFEALRVARITYNPLKAPMPSLRKEAPTSFFTPKLMTPKGEEFREILPLIKTVAVLDRYTSKF
jgi:hypothetical protein